MSSSAKQGLVLSSSSSTSLHEPSISAQEASTTNHRALARSSSIRFSDDTNDSSRTSMAHRTTASSSDEIIPIRHAAGDPGRSYNTTQPSESLPSASSATPTTKPSKATTAEPISPPDEPAAKKSIPWHKRIAEKYGSITLDNKGSVARDHLALERTFLAWLRTSLAFASIGIAITQLFRLNTSFARRSTTIDLNMPLAPLLGHSVPAELLPYLQQILTVPVPSVETPTLGPTLLDQLLLIPAADQATRTDHSSEHSDVHGTASAEKIRHLGKPLGATFIGISIVVLLVGFHRYFESQYWIIRGKFPASRGSVALVGFIAGALIIASLVVVVVVNPAQLEKKR